MTNIIYSAEDYYKKGMENIKFDKFNRAIKDFSKAKKINPNLVEAYICRGVCYEYFNQHKKAINDFTKAIEINPNLVLAYQNRGISYERIM